MQPQEHRLSPNDYDENFPIASSLLPARMRQPLRDFYSYARGLDELSDHPAMPREEKREKLRVIRLAFQEKREDLVPDWAMPAYRRVRNGELPATALDQLWQAFWQDTEKQRYRSFDEVIDYCVLSTVPVGRTFLKLAKEEKADLKAADALCCVIQLLNHLQDVREDFLYRGRIYLPQQWLEEEGLSERVLNKAETGPKLHRVFCRWLDEIDARLKTANRLPKSLKNRRLRWEMRAILAIARGLSRKLRKSDVMEKRVKLSKFHRACLGAGGILRLC